MTESHKPNVPGIVVLLTIAGLGLAFAVHSSEGSYDNKVSPAKQIASEVTSTANVAKKISYAEAVARQFEQSPYDLCTILAAHARNAEGHPSEVQLVNRVIDKAATMGNGICLR